MQQYLEMVEDILLNGEERSDRTGQGTISIFGMQKKYDLSKGFPLVTTKRIIFDSVVKELLWFISGSTNTKDLGCGIWDQWADEYGSLGPIYGSQWRGWEGANPYYGSSEYDQLTDLLSGIKNDPFSRRHIVSAWNVGQLADMRLAPCHCFFQCYVTPRGTLDLQMYQRSADMALGVPFNIASYALLTHMLAKECGLKPGVFTHSIGDAHIYKNHIEGLKEQLSRTPGALPNIVIVDKPFFDLRYEDIQLLNYNPQKRIKFEVAI